MSNVFLTECADFGEAQVVKSFLESQGFHPRVRDEQTRTVAPHLQQLLGKLIIEIPEHEFLNASHALESLEKTTPLHVVGGDDEAREALLTYTQSLSKKCLINAVLGCIFIPVLCNLYSMVLGWKVLAQERPLSAISRHRIMLAIVFNTIAFYVWLAFGFKYFLKNM